MKNQYSTADIQYSYRKNLRKWEFSGKDFSLVVALKNGKESANRVAKQVSAFLKRTKRGELDELGRFYIRQHENYI